MFSLIRKLIVWALFAIFMAFVVAFLSHRHIAEESADKLFDKIEDLPSCDVALVLGTSPTLKNGTVNPYFKYRIDKALELYKSGKVKHFILSGDNSRVEYDEPEAMKQALVAKGVPESAISLDYAGFRTFDSMIRAKEIFGQQKFIVVSQAFHNARAIYLAQQFGLEVYGANAEDVPTNSTYFGLVREYLARTKAILDVKVLDTEPKFLGEKITLPL